MPPLTATCLKYPCGMNEGAAPEGRGESTGPANGHDVAEPESRAEIAVQSCLGEVLGHLFLGFLAGVALLVIISVRAGMSGAPVVVVWTAGVAAGAAFVYGVVLTATIRPGLYLERRAEPDVAAALGTGWARRRRLAALVYVQVVTACAFALGSMWLLFGGDR